MNGLSIITLRWMQTERMHFKNMRQLIGQTKDTMPFLLQWMNSGQALSFLTPTISSCIQTVTIPWPNFLSCMRIDTRGIGSYVATHQETQKPPWFSIQGERSTIVPMNRWRFALLRQASCALYQRCHSTLQCSASIGLNDSLRPILKSSTDMWEAIRWEAVWQPALPPSMPTSWKA